MTLENQHQLGLELIASEAPTLDNFVVGRNTELIASIRRFMRGQPPQVLFIWGPSGSGCTHLLRAMAPRQTERVPTYTDAVDLYVVDDVEKLNAHELEALFHLFNAVRAHPESRIALAGHQPLSQLTIREDVRSRLTWGLVFELQFLDEHQARVEFLRLARERGIELTEEIEHWIALHCPRDIGSLVALLNGIDRYAIEAKRKVTLPLILRYLAEKQ